MKSQPSSFHPADSNSPPLPPGGNVYLAAGARR